MHTLSPNVPKFLFIDNPSDDATDPTVGYVLHSESPAMLIRFTAHPFGYSGEPLHWFTDPNVFAQQTLASGQDPAQSLARLMREAGDFLNKSL